MLIRCAYANKVLSKSGKYIRRIATPFRVHSEYDAPVIRYLLYHGDYDQALHDQQLRSHSEHRGREAREWYAVFLLLTRLECAPFRLLAVILWRMEKPSVVEEVRPCKPLVTPVVKT